MLARSTRQRKEYLYKKALDEKQTTIFEKKKRLRDALENDKAIPTELRSKDGEKLRSGLDLEDERTQEQATSIDDEYAYMGVQDPKVILTTARDPSSRLMSFMKELRLLVPNSQRINRGSYVMKELVDMARTNDVTDIVIVHEHRGEPDGMIISHLPYGPTAYFGLKNVILRHDLAEKQATMSEAAPHLVFHQFETALGKRISTVLKALFPPAAPLCNRVMTFANHRDTIHFRHYNYGTGGEGNNVALENGSANNDKGEKGEDGGDKGDKGAPQRKKRKTENLTEKDVSLREVGPRFSMQLYRMTLGTLDMKEAKTEWVLRPYFNKQKDAL